MKSDGQLYTVKHKGEHTVLPPPSIEDECPACKSSSFKLGQEELLIIGLIILLLSDKCETDLPLIIALAYILFSR